MKNLILVLGSGVTMSFALAGPCDGGPINFNVNNYVITVERHKPTTPFDQIQGFTLVRNCNLGRPCSSSGTRNMVVETSDGLLQNQFVISAGVPVPISSERELSNFPNRQGHVRLSLRPVPGCGGLKGLSLEGVNGTSVSQLAETAPRSTPSQPTPVSVSPSGR